MPVIVIILVLLRLYFLGPSCSKTRDLTGQVIIVTGANTGIGYETVKKLASLNANVILACRNEKLGKEALERIKADVKNGSLTFLQLDLGSLKSISNFAKEFHSKFSRLDILINNAGVMVPNERTLTADGFEV